MKHIFIPLAALVSEVAQASTDMSEYFENLDFESCEMDDGGWASSIGGWTINYDLNMPDLWVYNSNHSNNGSMGAFLNGNFFVNNIWSSSNLTISAGKFLSQTSTETLPAGTYTVSATVDACNLDDFYIYAGDDVLNFSATGWGAPQTCSITTTLDGSSTLEIGFGLASELAYTAQDWYALYIDDVTVTLVAGDDENESTTADTSTRVVGADISLVPAYEAAGDIWLDADGHAINTYYDDGMITFLRDVAGLTSMRVRLLVNPDNDDYVATCQDITYVKELGKRIKDAGLYFLLDIFYSDTWCDVSSQWIPADWGLTKSTDAATLAEKVKAYTTESINELVAYGAAPDFVQIGNEISYGMLWSTSSEASKSNAFYTSGSYSTYSTQINRCATLLTAAAEGVRASDAAEAKIVLHCERTLTASQCYNFYNWLETAGFSDYDIIGLSYYPVWHGTLSNLTSTLSTLTKNFPSKEIQIVETGYYTNSYGTASSYCTWDYSADGLNAFLTDLIATLEAYDNVTGLYYWQIEECGNGADSSGSRVMDSWDNRAFWALSYESSSHTLEAADALMTLQTFVTEQANTTTTTTEIDASGYFTNLDFESCATTDGEISEITGWELTYNFTSGPWASTNAWASSLTDSYLITAWHQSSSTASEAHTVIAQSTTVPAGTYKISVVAHADGTDAFSLFANDDATAITDLGSNSWSTAAKYSVTTTLEAEGTLTIGIKCAEIAVQSTEINLYFDNFAVVSVVEVETNDNTVTNVRNVADVAIEAIYGVDGARRGELGRGVNIVRFSDGTTQKILVK